MVEMGVGQAGDKHKMCLPSKSTIFEKSWTLKKISDFFSCLPHRKLPAQF
jgi:hypothetical protein